MLLQETYLHYLVSMIFSCIQWLHVANYKFKFMVFTKWKVPKGFLLFYNVLDGNSTMSFWWDRVKACSAGSILGWSLFSVSLFLCGTWLWLVPLGCIIGCCMSFQWWECLDDTCMWWHTHYLYIHCCVCQVMACWWLKIILSVLCWLLDRWMGLFWGNVMHYWELG